MLTKLWPPQSRLYLTMSKFRPGVCPECTLRVVIYLIGYLRDGGGASQSSLCGVSGSVSWPLIQNADVLLSPSLPPSQLPRGLTWTAAWLRSQWWQRSSVPSASACWLSLFITSETPTSPLTKPSCPESQVCSCLLWQKFNTVMFVVQYLF